MKKEQLEESENEFDVDEPDEIQNNHSDDDWTPEVSGRRQSSRLRNSTRKRFTEVSSSEEVSDEDESDDDFKRRRSRQRKVGRHPMKKQRVSSTTNENSDSQQGDGEAKSNSNSDSEPSSTTNAMKVGKEFSSGAFVVMKTDFASEEKPPIWKIDGKALLQKYVPFEEDGKTLYKNTSVYSGWSANNKAQYYPASVVFKQHNRKAHVVEFQKDLIKADPEGTVLQQNNVKPEVDDVEDGEEDEVEDEEEEEEDEEDEEEEDGLENDKEEKEPSESEDKAQEVEEVDE